MNQPLTTTCETCGGVGRDLDAGVLVPCTDCEGEGRVPAIRVHDWYGAFVEDQERWPSYLLAIPKPFREECPA